MPLPGRVWRTVSFILIALAVLSLLGSAPLLSTFAGIRGLALVAVLQPFMWAAIVTALVADSRFKNYIACPSCGSIIRAEATRCRSCAGVVDEDAVITRQRLTQEATLSIVLFVYIAGFAVACYLVTRT